MVLSRLIAFKDLTIPRSELFVISRVSPAAPEKSPERLAREHPSTLLPSLVEAEGAGADVSTHTFA